MSGAVNGYDLDLFGEPILDEAAQFDVGVRPATEEEKRAMNPHSYGRRLTERLRALAEQGINPLVGTRGPDGQTCGDCIHRKYFCGGAKSYPKCDLGPITSGPKTDVRKNWPACHRHEPAE